MTKVIKSLDIFHTLHDFPAAVGTGQIQDVATINFCGSVDSPQQDALRDFTGLDDGIPLPASTGVQLEVVSDSASDTVAVNIEGLGADGVLIAPMAVVLTGITPVLLPEALVSRINVLDSDEDLVGTITIQPQNGGTIFAQINAGDQEYVPGIVSIPANTEAVFGQAVFASKDSSPMGSQVFIKSKRLDQNNFRRGFSFWINGDSSAPITFNNKYPKAIKGPRDVKLSIIAQDPNTKVEACVSGLIFNT